MDDSREWKFAGRIHGNGEVGSFEEGGLSSDFGVAEEEREGSWMILNDAAVDRALESRDSTV
ncbi:unnamed protein product [Onchocerca flexuosa]|nr:unnamed protein product [Onchocerca flexuosa]